MPERVECPYCESYVDISDWFEHTDGYTQGEFDMTCTNCEELFEVKIEMSPSFNSDKIVLEHCVECKRQYRSDGQSFPRPTKYQDIPLSLYQLCTNCYHSLIVEELKDYHVGKIQE